MCMSMARKAAVRDYAPVLSRARGLDVRPARDEQMKACIDALWDAFGGPGPGRGVSWVGVYSRSPQANEMILEYRRNKPACSPIGLHGMCGRCALENRCVVVHDVRTLGAGYIACDPRDLSEVVIPLGDGVSAPWGVLDVDSHDVGAFSEVDAEALVEVAVAFGLTAAAPLGQVLVL